MARNFEEDFEDDFDEEGLHIDDRSERRLRRKTMRRVANARQGPSWMERCGEAVDMLFSGLCDVFSTEKEKDGAVEALCLLYSVFKLAKTKGDLALESHVERFDQSPLFYDAPLIGIRGFPF